MIIFPSPHYQTIGQLKNVFAALDPLCHGYHIDIMDGHFVPDTMGSIKLTNQIAQLTTRQLWIHLMVKDPVNWTEQLQLRSGDIVSAHYTALTNSIDAFIAATSKQNLRPSLAIKPAIPIQDILPLCKTFEHILVMAVEPGKAGQTFLAGTASKITELVNYRAHQEISLTIAIDGGVNAQNIKKLRTLGVSSVATTSALFNAESPNQLIENFKLLI